MNIRGPYTPRQRHTTVAHGGGMTKQAHKNESDVNWIVAKYIKTGVIEHGNANSARYGFAPAVDFREALELIDEAKQQFDTLPAKVRKEFDNSAEKFLKFCEQPDAAEKLIELGVEAATPPWKQDKPEPTPPAPTEPTPTP